MKKNHADIQHRLLDECVRYSTDVTLIILNGETQSCLLDSYIMAEREVKKGLTHGRIPKNTKVQVVTIVVRDVDLDELR